MHAVFNLSASKLFDSRGKEIDPVNVMFPKGKVPSYLEFVFKEMEVSHILENEF